MALCYAGRVSAADMTDKKPGIPRLAERGPRQERRSEDIDCGFVSLSPDILFSRTICFASVDERRDIVDLARQALEDAYARLGNPLDTIILEPLGGGRSGAHIFKATSSAGCDHDRKALPTVLKILPLTNGLRERANFNAYVLPLLPAIYRPELLSFASAHGHAALCYSFIGDDERSDTLTDCLAMGDLTALDCVLSSLIETLRQCWYSAVQGQAETDLARYYHDRYFDTPGAAAAAEKLLLAHASRYFDAQQCAQGYRIGRTAFPSMCATLFTDEEARAYKSYVVHGDLNSDNIILDRDRSRAQLIDFQRTGRGHGCQDLVALEASLRINYPSNAPVSEIFEIEQLIACRDPRIRSNAYAMAIVGIRETACRLFGVEEAANYQFAVATIGLRLMRATDLSGAALARISASALWAAKLLAEN